MNFICEGIDRLGKDELINGIMQKDGFYQVIHRSKPLMLEKYFQESAATGKISPFYFYQAECFKQDMEMLRESEHSNFRIIFNRSWLGEAVYAPLYRGYSGDYVFDLEKEAEVKDFECTRLILLIEDFYLSSHFVDDSQSLGPIHARKQEQAKFIEAFVKSELRDKRIICVTDANGQFRPKAGILADALAPMQTANG